jgi:putative ATP-binding cassette transporter
MVAAPRYLAGKIELGELMQINSAFGNVQESFSWFISAYQTSPRGALPVIDCSVSVRP